MSTGTPSSRSYVPAILQAESETLSFVESFRQMTVDDSVLSADSLLCCVCRGRFGRVEQLAEHLNEEYKWIDYSCPCGYRRYVKEKVVAHMHAECLYDAPEKRMIVEEKFTTHVKRCPKCKTAEFQTCEAFYRHLALCTNGRLSAR